ncbi:PRC-barrel domain-containing protein [Paraburkholderia caballeronis]|uniref:PRC-barrel domain-containing protein n=1 Tax=Paraburkholderia caballeronis TaxID=416943 RepID=UPI0010667520|nr:PRC-barrel domain-containing protein [Paraburkholderia caballeronis]TDV19614.1 hypothetical protein C7408_102359 [Paraburkholderia caballeronis]TDV22213.1 hypothetical protein C7406_101358 [Paraburkholderia caballeronis]TDV29117.1 hypothetical protein C7404_102359 [Paraburkholderia caballeronis]
MLRSVTALQGCAVHASDGDLGRIDQIYFDDEAWGLRYLVVETGDWLRNRQVLISPISVKHVDWSSGIVHVNLTRQQVRDSPAIDTHKPVSRQHEIDYLRYYNYPAYWAGPNLWGRGAWPAFDRAGAAPPRQTLHTNRVQPEVHLRSTEEVKGYDLETADGSLGHLSGLVYDDRMWVIRYLAVDPRNWWPEGKTILIATPWIELVDWLASSASTSLTRDEVRRSPAYDDAAPVRRSYEATLHEFYGKEGYWSREETPPPRSTDEMDAQDQRIGLT